MLNKTLRTVTCVILAGGLAGCGLFSKEKVHLDGERISVLSGSTIVQPDYPAGNVKIRLPEPRLNIKWSQSGGDATHVMGHLQSNDKIKEFWTASFGEGSSKRDLLIAAPAVAHQVVFAIDAEALVTARRLDNGQEIWHKRLKPLNRDDKGIALKGSGVAYDNQRIYATTGFGGVFALNMRTGKEIWRYDTAMPIRIAPTVKKDRLFVQTIDNNLIAIDTANGQEIWKYKTSEEATTLVGGASPAYSVEQDVVVAAFTNGELRAFKASTGTPLWSDMLVSRKRTNSLANITTVKANPIIDGDKVFAVGHSDLLAAIDLRTGSRIWEREISSTNQPWVVGQYMYVLSDAFELIAFEKNSGKAVWTKKLPIPEHSTGLSAVGPILSNNSLIAALSDGHVFAISPYNGNVLGFINIGEEIEISPILADGVVIFTTNDAELAAYK